MEDGAYILENVHETQTKHSHGIFFRGCDGSDRHRETSSEGCYLAGKISTFYTVTTLKLHGKFYLI